MEGWMEEEEEVALVAHKLALTHTHAHTHTHTHTSLPWCPSSLDPSSFWILQPAACWELYSGMGILCALPPPHTHSNVHTQPQILSLSRSTLLHITADCKNHPLQHGRVVAQNAEMWRNMCNIRECQFLGKATQIKCGGPCGAWHSNYSLIHNIM